MTDSSLLFLLLFLISLDLSPSIEKKKRRVLRWFRYTDTGDTLYTYTFNPGWERDPPVILTWNRKGVHKNWDSKLRPYLRNPCARVHVPRIAECHVHIRIRRRSLFEKNEIRLWDCCISSAIKMLITKRGNLHLRLPKRDAIIGKNLAARPPVYKILLLTRERERDIS